MIYDKNRKKDKYVNAAEYPPDFIFHCTLDKMKEVMLSGNGSLHTFQNIEKSYLFGEPDPVEQTRLLNTTRKFKRDGSYWGEYNLKDQKDGRIICLRPDRISFRHYKEGLQHGRRLTIRKNNGVINIVNFNNGIEGNVIVT